MIDKPGVRLSAKPIRNDLPRCISSNIGGGNAHLVNSGLLSGGDAINRHALTAPGRGFRFGGVSSGDPGGFRLGAVDQGLRLLESLVALGFCVAQHGLGLFAQTRCLIQLEADDFAVPVKHAGERLPEFAAEQQEEHDEGNCDPIARLDEEVFLVHGVDFRSGGGSGGDCRSGGR